MGETSAGCIDYGGASAFFLHRVQVYGKKNEVLTYTQGVTPSA
jgi:hypothetical protein